MRHPSTFLSSCLVVTKGELLKEAPFVITYCTSSNATDLLSFGQLEFLAPSAVPLIALSNDFMRPIVVSEGNTADLILRWLPR